MHTFFCVDICFVYLGDTPSGEIAGSCSKSTFNSSRSCQTQTFPELQHWVTFSRPQGVKLPIPPSILASTWLFDSPRHSGREVVFVCISLMTSVVLTRVFPFACFFVGETSSQTFCIFLKTKLPVVLLSRESSLCVLDTSPSSVMQFANIFSHSGDVTSLFWWCPLKHESF